LTEDDVDQGEKNERVSGARNTVVIGGTTYLVKPPADQDFADLHLYIRKRLASPIAMIAEDVKGLPPHLQKMAIEAAVAVATGGGAKLTEAFVDEQMRTPDVCSYLAWLLVSKNHPDVKLETLRAAIPTDAEALRVLKDMAEGWGDLQGNRAGRSAS
jgi:hypothetical protein